MFSNGWRYHIILVLKDDAPQKLEHGFGDMGIDPGVSTMACTADTGCVLEELAPETDRYDRQIQEILRKMDRSRRKSNPDKYNPDRNGQKERPLQMEEFKELHPSSPASADPLS